jgi:hypothetical protein
MGTALLFSTMQITYAQLFKFMGTFTNQQLDDAQVIAEYLHERLGKSYNQCLVDILVEIRKEQLAS